MTLVSLTDCCHLLGVDPKTLRRWMSLFQLEALPHPTDARIKCLTSAMVQQLAAAYHRTLLDERRTHFQQEISTPDSPTVASRPVLSDVPPDFSPLISDLITQLGSLQAHVATLQGQLALLTDQLQKEQEWRISQASTAEEQSQESPQEQSQERSLEQSQEKSQERSLHYNRTCLKKEEAIPMEWQSLMRAQSPHVRADCSTAAICSKCAIVRREVTPRERL